MKNKKISFFALQPFNKLRAQSCEGQGKILKYFLIFSVCFLSAFFILSIFRGGALSIARAEETKLGDTAGYFWGMIMLLFFKAASSVIGISGKVLNWAFSFPTFKGVKAVDEVWYVLRDICNMFFIVILMVSAIATILRIEKYKFQDIIKYLIIAILAINFSKTITYVVVDFTQVLSRSFLSMAGAGLGPNASVGQVSEQLANNMGMTAIFKSPAFWGGAGDVKFQGTWDMVWETLLSSVVMMVAGITFLVGAIMLIVRWIVILILIAVSAAAWGFYAIPDLRSYHTKWWNILLSYAFFAPVYSFYIGFALILVKAGGYTPPSGELVSTGVTAFTRNPVYFLNYIISIIVLWLGLNKAKSFGSGMSNKIVSGASERGQNFLKGKWIAPRTRAALMAEHKARKAEKEKLKLDTAKDRASKLYKPKDWVHDKVADLDTAARSRLRSMPGGGKIFREKSYGSEVLENRKKSEANKERLEKAKEYKDTPPSRDTFKNIFAENKAASDGTKQALAQYLGENTGNFDGDYDTAFVQFKGAVAAFGSDETSKSGFIRKVKKSRVDLVARYNAEINRTPVDTEMQQILTGMGAKDIAEQAETVFTQNGGTNAFVNTINSIIAGGRSFVRQDLIRSGASDNKLRNIT